MLHTDKKAIDRAFDRYAAGGSDNRHGTDLDTVKYYHQVGLYIARFCFDNTAAEKDELWRYADAVAATSLKS